MSWHAFSPPTDLASFDGRVRDCRICGNPAGPPWHEPAPPQAVLARPTIAELEAILAQDEATLRVETQPSGEIRAVPAAPAPADRCACGHVASVHQGGVGWCSALLLTANCSCAAFRPQSGEVAPVITTSARRKPTLEEEVAYYRRIFPGHCVPVPVEPPPQAAPVDPGFDDLRPACAPCLRLGYARCTHPAAPPPAETAHGPECICHGCYIKNAACESWCGGLPPDDDTAAYGWIDNGPRGVDLVKLPGWRWRERGWQHGWCSAACRDAAMAKLRVPVPGCSLHPWLGPEAQQCPPAADDKDSGGVAQLPSPSGTGRGDPQGHGTASSGVGKPRDAGESPAPALIQSDEATIRAIADRWIQKWAGPLHGDSGGAIWSAAREAFVESKRLALEQRLCALHIEAPRELFQCVACRAAAIARRAARDGGIS